MKEKFHRECFAISSRDMALGRAYVLGEDISRWLIPFAKEGTTQAATVDWKEDTVAF